MGKEISYISDIKDDNKFEVNVFVTLENTVRIYIDDYDSQYGTAWIDFNKESLNYFIKDLKDLHKKLS